MEGIKTIDEFSNHFWNENPDSTIEVISKKTAKKMAIAFARYHVSLALSEITEKAMIETDDYGMRHINENSILNAYPLSNIK